MAKTASYTKKDLSYSAAQCRRTILNRLQNGSINKVPKTYAFNCVAQHLHLKSARTLWKGESLEYLNAWFDRLDKEVQQLIESENINTSKSIKSIDYQNTDDINNLRKKLSDANKLIEEYEDALKVLRSENEELRMRYIQRYGDIDL